MSLTGTGGGGGGEGGRAPLEPLYAVLVRGTQSGHCVGCLSRVLGSMFREIPTGDTRVDPLFVHVCPREGPHRESWTSLLRRWLHRDPRR